MKPNVTKVIELTSQIAEELTTTQEQIFLSSENLSVTSQNSSLLTTVQEDQFLHYMVGGSIFLAFSAWWLINILGRYYHSLGKNSSFQYESSVSYPCNCCPCGRNGTLEIEGIVKVLIAITAVILSVIGHTTRKANGTDTLAIHAENTRITTIIIAFGAQGMVDIIAHSSAFLPRGIEFIGAALTFVIEGLLLHSDNSAVFIEEVKVLEGLAYACAACLIAEMMWRNAIHLSLLKVGGLMLQGLWLWQIGFHMTKDTSIRVLLVLTLGTVFGVIVIISMFMGLAHRCCSGDGANVDYYKYDGKDGAVTQLIKRDSNGHTIINFHDESDSDTEFELPSRTKK